MCAGQSAKPGPHDVKALAAVANGHTANRLMKTCRIATAIHGTIKIMPSETQIQQSRKIWDRSGPIYGSPFHGRLSPAGGRRIENCGRIDREEKSSPSQP